MNSARVTIGSWPTPVRRMERASESLGRDIWVKVEEECGAWGGNKVRKLEHILAAARADKITKFVSYGAGTSNWTAALAHHAGLRGFHVTVGLAGPIPQTYRELYDDAGTTVVSSGVVNALPVVMARARLVAGAGARSVPMGGSGFGDIGCVGIGQEIADAIDSGSIPSPAAIFVAVGTAGTAAGTAVGLAKAGKPIPLVAVRVAPWPFGSRKRVLRHGSRLLRRLAIDAQLNVVGDGRFLRPGYARPNEASLEAIEIARRDGLELDPTYAAKAFAAVIDSARTRGGEPLLFIHTSPGPPPS